MKRKISTRLSAWLAVASLAACSDSTTPLRQIAPRDASHITKIGVTVNLCKLTGVADQTYSFDPTVGGVAGASLGLKVGDCAPVYSGLPADVGVTETSATPDSIVAWRTDGTTAADTVRVVGGKSVLVSPAAGSTWTINVYNPLPPGPKTEVCKITGFPGQTYMFTVGIGFGPLTPLVLQPQSCQYVYSAPTIASPPMNVTATETSAAPDSIIATLIGDLTGTSTIRLYHQSAATVVASGTAGWSIKFFNPVPPPTAACATITAVLGVPITQVTLIGTGGTGAPYKFSAVGLAAAGLAISTDGTISGTPTVAGTFPYTVTVTDKDGHSGSFDCSVTVNGAPTTSCVSITAVQGFPIASTTLTGSGGTGGPYKFSATGLPTGLTMSVDGTISGTPMVSGTFPYVVTVTDKDGHSGTFNCSVVVNGPPTTNCVVVDAIQGVPILATTLTGSGGTGGPYKFSAINLPPGLTMSTDGTITGTPTASGAFLYTVTVTDKDGHSGTFNCSIVVNVPPSASCVSVTAVQGVPVSSAPLTGTGGTGGPYKFSAVGLPAGLTMALDGSISGTTQASGTFPYTVTVTDKDGHTGTFGCSVTVSVAPSGNCVSITAVQGVGITNATVTGTGGTGGPYTFSAVGLPTGLSMGTDGTISGTPMVSGTFYYTVTVTDKDGHTGTFKCSITVNPPPTGNCASITAVMGYPVSSPALVGSGGTGGAYKFSAVGLPTGLTMAADGSISGTPTVSGTFPYTVTVTDKDGHTGTYGCSITVNAPPSASCIAITAVAGAPVSSGPLTGSGGTGGPYKFSAAGLPTGLSMAADGSITGTTTASGIFPYTVTVTDKDGHTGTFNCSITVNPAPSATCVTIYAVQGSAITSATLTGSGGTGGPYTFSAVGLPTGLTMSTSGVISGTPTVTGTFPYTVTVTDKDGHSGTFKCSVTVNAAPSATCVTINAVQGSPITAVTLTGSGGTGGPYKFSVGLPAGLTMSSAGTISGTPSVSGTFEYTVTITDKDGHTGTFKCTVTVMVPPCPSCTTITVLKGVAMTSVTLTGSGGTGAPYTYSNAKGLPAGVTISSKGVISGTPSVSGTFTYTVTVTDKDGHTGTFTCTIIVIYDKTPPVCTVVDGTYPYMTYQDGGSGIVSLHVDKNLNNNFAVTVTPTPTGTVYSPSTSSQPNHMPTGTLLTFPTPVTGLFKVSATRIDTKQSAQLTVTATDAAGNAVTCDPVLTTLQKLKQDDGVQTFTDLPYAEHFVTISNGGMWSVDLNVNGTTFSVKRLDDNEVRTVDVSSAMKHNNKNVITITPNGKKGDTADLTIGPGT